MKNKKTVVFFVVIFAILLILPSICRAANTDEYLIDLTYEGNVLVGEEKESSAILKGVEATPHSNVRINVKVDGPATPELIAIDSHGTKINIVDYGYWGPEQGFAVGGNFNNITPVKAKFPKAGKYTITLSLVDMQNNQSIIVSKAFEINVGFHVTTIVDGTAKVQYAESGDTIESLGIVHPEKEGYTFKGWYLEDTFETPLQEEKGLTDTTTLYAKFEVVEQEGATEPSENTTPTEEVKDKKDETPKTGMTTYLAVALTTVAISILALSVLRKRKVQ